MRAPLNKSWSDITEGADEGIGRPRQALAAKGVRVVVLRCCQAIHSLTAVSWAGRCVDFQAVAFGSRLRSRSCCMR
jgi:hypothetical protein